jgi:hypothetical protein
MVHFDYLELGSKLQVVLGAILVPLHHIGIVISLLADLIELRQDSLVENQQKNRLVDFEEPKIVSLQFEAEILKSVCLQSLKVE